MFQDTLLIIKCDYLAKRKAVLLHLLHRGFLIKGQRKINFSPELAAEFYQNLAEDHCFMFQVIMLSKGNSEAFILCKENAVEDLLNTMVCYFGTSLGMEQHVHVTKCQTRVQKEISYIFPNYIYEPIQRPEQLKFCINNPVVECTITTLYDIITKPEIEPHKTWKVKLAEFLLLSNKGLPQISNQCSYNTNLMVQETSQQTKITSMQHKKAFKEFEQKSSLSGLNLSTDAGTSAMLTTTSCISCSSFSSAADCKQQTYEQQPYEHIIKSRSAPLDIKESVSSRKSDLPKDTFDKWNIEEFVGVEDTISLEKDSVIHGYKTHNFVLVDSIESVVSSPPTEDLNLKDKDSTAVDASDVMSYLVSVKDTEEENKSIVEESFIVNEEAIKKEASTTSIKKDNTEHDENVSMVSKENVHNTEDIPESNLE